MMKTLPCILLLICLSNSAVLAQSPDSSYWVSQADSLLNRVDQMRQGREVPQALQLAEQAELLIRERLGVLGEPYARCCFLRGICRFMLGDVGNAEPLFLKARDIRAGTVGKEHPLYALSQNSLGVLYDNMGRADLAEPLYLDAIRIWGNTVGKYHPDYAKAVSNLGQLYSAAGRFQEAEPLLLESAEIRKNTLGADHPLYAQTVLNLGNLYDDLALFEKAEQCFLSGVSIMKNALGEDHPDYGTALNNLGAFYLNSERPAEAEKFLLKSRSIQESAMGPESPGLADVMSNLGYLYSLSGRFAEAEKLLLRVVQIRAKYADYEPFSYLNGMGNLAMVYMNTGRFKESEQLYLQMISLLDSMPYVEPKMQATTWQNLAAVYVESGQYAEAEKWFLKANKVWIENKIQSHRSYLSGIADMGLNYAAMGKYSEAEALYLEAKNLTWSRCGKRCSQMPTVLMNMQILYWKSGRLAEAVKTIRESSAYLSEWMGAAPLQFSETEMRHFANRFQVDICRHLSFTETFPKADPELPGICYNDILFHKGYLLHSAARLRKHCTADTAVLKVTNKIQLIQKGLAREYAKAQNERQDLSHLEQEAVALEKVLLREVPGYGQALQQVAWPDVQARLHSGEAAIEFVHYRYYQPYSTNSVRYAALVLRPGAKMPAFIPLFDEKQLDSLMHTEGERKADYVSKLYTVAERGATPLEKPQKTLYELLWMPLEKELAGINRIYFSPAGLLHRLNLGAIPVESESTLADRYQLVELGSTRQLVAPYTEGFPAKPEGDALLFGGIRFDSDSTAIAQANAGLAAGALVSRGAPTNFQPDPGLRGTTWNYLKWTEKEVDALVPILKTAGLNTTVRKGHAATEEAFKSIGTVKPSPRILHVATHGFFFPDLRSESADDTKNAAAGLTGNEPVFKTSEHPMIRSGLLLAGANKAWSSGKPASEKMDDGILTAYEISQMNLSGTELVILSACETGLGDISGNEGVFGLQRAFKIAGAKYLIMSLWQVPDFQTQELMVTFYRHWLEQKKAIPEAFRIAQQEMRDKYQNPYFWAGFVLVE